MDEVHQSRKEIVITKRGKPVACLVPTDDDIPRIFGRMKDHHQLWDIVAPTGEKRDADE